MVRIYVKRDPKESFERMLSRFKKLLQKTHKINEVKAKSRFSKKPTKREERRSAIMREHYRNERRRKQFY
jgi:ribosomal protein S21